MSKIEIVHCKVATSNMGLGYYPAPEHVVNRMSSSDYISKQLGMDEYEFYNLCAEYGAHKYHYFGVMEECQKFVDEYLNPKLMMKALTGKLS